MLTIPPPVIQFLSLFYKSVPTSEGPEYHLTEMSLGGLGTKGHRDISLPDINCASSVEHSCSNYTEG